MGRLKGIPTIISPELLHVLASMGHGDEIVLADANFPTSSICKAGPREVRSDGHGIPELLQAILKLLPLDFHVNPVSLMDIEPLDALRDVETPIWDTYRKIIEESQGKSIQFEMIKRFDFYKRAKTAYAVVHTGEVALYGNIILKKGIVEEK